MASSIAPLKARACLLCGVVLDYRDFVNRGCPNCDHLLFLRDAPDSVNRCTSASFESLSLFIKPPESWAARFMHISQDAVPGMYAIKIDGILPPDVVEILRDNNVVWIPRDGTDIETAVEQDI